VSRAIQTCFLSNFYVHLHVYSIVLCLCFWLNSKQTLWLKICPAYFWIYLQMMACTWIYKNITYVNNLPVNEQNICTCLLFVNFSSFPLVSGYTLALQFGTDQPAPSSRSWDLHWRWRSTRPLEQKRPFSLLHGSAAAPG